ncbi:MAG: rhodanese-like domain-containing protein [Chthoniobacterales bacterium]|nr:rhodanese-like domain-containing protein [Chthoniobacterales bacterium]
MSSSSELLNRGGVQAWRLLAIVSAAALLAAANFVFNPNRPAAAEDALQEGEIRLKDAAASRSPVLWIDARPQSEFDRGHVPGAMLLNEDHWDDLLPAVLEAWMPGRPLVVYCGSEGCRASHQVAERLRVEAGLPDVHVLKGGWEAWLAGQH